jgi:hypothetical protein
MERRTEPMGAKTFLGKKSEYGKKHKINQRKTQEDK